MLHAQNILVLGAGLGSAAYILGRMRIAVNTTFVDIDETVIDWAKELLPPHLSKHNHWICADAKKYVQEETVSYDIIVIDIFLDRIVPQFVSSNDFLSHCAQLLNYKSGKLILNYIVNNKNSWQETQTNIARLFTIEHIINLGLNQVVIAQAK